MTDLVPILQSTQGNTLVGFGRHLSYGRIYLLKVVLPQYTADWLSQLVPQIMSDADFLRRRPTSAVNVAFTWDGLHQFGLPSSILERLPVAFQQGMRQRAQRFLGDRGPNAPPPGAEELPRASAWKPEWDSSPHVMVAVYAATPTDLLRASARLVSGLKLAGVQLAGSTQFSANVQPLRVTGSREVAWSNQPDKTLREHFGFIDGSGEPDIEGLSDAIHAIRSQQDPNRAQTVRDEHLGVFEHGAWRPIRAGEFLFGLENEGGGLTPQPRESDRNSHGQFDLYRTFMLHGTFLACRELQQRVRVFRKYLQTAAAATGMSADAVGARLVGRWKNGAPLALNGTSEEADRFVTEVSNGLRPPSDLNAFTYLRAGETDGDDALRVPRGSHIRRANPRDGLPGDPTGVKRRRMLRRGIPYGAELPEDADLHPSIEQLAEADDLDDRGLLFISLQANLAGQFELVQREWLNDGDVFGQARDRDPLTGDDDPGRLLTPGFKRPVLSDIPPFVRVRGGAYFLKPSIGALKRMAAGDWRPST